jgi:hypothetical protein
MLIARLMLSRKDRVWEYTRRLLDAKAYELFYRGSVIRAGAERRGLTYEQTLRGAQLMAKAQRLWAYIKLKEKELC